MKDILYHLLPSLAGWPLWGQVLLIVLVTALLAFSFRALLRVVERLYKRTPNMWDDTLVFAIRRPLYYLIWTVGVLLALDVGMADNALLAETILPLREVVLLLLIAWITLRLLRATEQSLLTKRRKHNPKYDKTTLHAVMKILRLMVVLATVLVAMQMFGYNVNGIMAAGGVGGLAIGFAAKDLLANFFGAMMIYLDRPFSVGDWVRSPDRDIEGTIEDIGWRLTRIRTFDKRLLYVPNSVFTTIAVENPSRMSHRRIRETIGVRYDDMSKAGLITDQVRTMLRNHVEIDNGQTLMVHVNEFGASSVDFFIYCFTRTTDWQKFHGVKQDVLLKIGQIIAENGAEIAFPTQVVQLEKMDTL